MGKTAGGERVTMTPAGYTLGLISPEPGAYCDVKGWRLRDRKADSR